MQRTATLRLSMTRDEWVALQLLQDRTADRRGPLQVEKVVNVGARRSGQDISVTVACDGAVEDVEALLLHHVRTVVNEMRAP